MSQHEKITHMTNGKGHEVPVDLVKASDRLIDQTVREIHRHGEELMSQIARFRAHTYDDMGTLMSLLAEKYQVKMRGLREGGRGNVSFKSYDGLLKVEISVQDYVEYGPELQIAKALMDDYIHEVSEGVPDEVKALLNHAFEVDKAGKVNREALYTLRRLEIDHPIYQRAMEAVKDSQRVESSRQFIRISTRPSTTENFKSMQINLANAEDLTGDEKGAGHG